MKRFSLALFVFGLSQVTVYATPPSTPQPTQPAPNLQPLPPSPALRTKDTLVPCGVTVALAAKATSPTSVTLTWSGFPGAYEVSSSGPGTPFRGSVTLGSAKLAPKQSDYSIQSRLRQPGAPQLFPASLTHAQAAPGSQYRYTIIGTLADGRKACGQVMATTPPAPQQPARMRVLVPVQPAQGPVLTPVPPAPSTANAGQCPAGQQLSATGSVVSAVRTIVVPGTASGMFSGVVLRKGAPYLYDRGTVYYEIAASGSIKVGVFGETGTSPDGWEPQGPAGPGFPAPDAHTFSLIHRVGSTGPWKSTGSGTVIRLGKTDPDQADLYFAINDTRTSDNDGSFNVTVTEKTLTTACRTPPPVQGGTTTDPNYGGTAGKAGHPASAGSSTPPLPCAGKTPNGLKLGFEFHQYCPGITYIQPIPVEACTYAEAMEEARQMANGNGCHLTELN